jgi:hypothetical protein
MNFFAWLQFVQALATAYATSQGKDARALGYLRVATGLVNGQQATDAELHALMTEYQQKVANQTPTTADELTALDLALAQVSGQIQATGG